ncbi:hypothetical protein VUR80DRAFT_8406 [Thermomyces stellatus]
MLMDLTKASRRMERSPFRGFLLNRITDGRNISLDLNMASFGDKNEAALKTGADSIPKLSSERRGPIHATPAEGVPRRIDFPYLRHSSYFELGEFVSVFQPRDIWLCTVNYFEWMSEGKNIRSLFGEYCSGDDFEHGLKMEMLEAQMKAQRVTQLTSQNVDSQRSLCLRA